jgi:aquaporin Z
MQKIDNRTAISYVLGQFAGALIGCIPILAWGSMGSSVSFGATMPGEGYALSTVLLGEIITTFTMVTLLAVFLAFRNLRPYTPSIFPFLYSIMSFLESAISGTSTNPARSFGPAVISGQWDAWWIYLIGPVTGSLLATLAVSFLAKRITVAKIYHFDTESDRLFRRKESANFEGS